MASTSQSALAAARLQQISETETGERAHRAAAGALVLRAVEQLRESPDTAAFLLLRATAGAGALQAAAESAILQRLLVLAAERGAPERLAAELVSYAYELEKTRRLTEADAVLALAVSVNPADAETALHAGRVARKLGEAPRALAWYRAAQNLDTTGTIGRLARVGEAVVSAAPERALGGVIREATRRGDAEAAAVGLEERAKLRRTAGDRRGAGRDLCRAVRRFPDGVDRARAAHELADLALDAGDAPAAREALRVALAFGDAPQRDHARSRLHTLARDLADEVGTRRWRSGKRPALVSLSLFRRRADGQSAGNLLARWRWALEHATAAVDRAV